MCVLSIKVPIQKSLILVSLFKIILSTVSSVNAELSADLFFSFQLDIYIPVKMDRKSENNPVIEVLLYLR